jgi:hypothetical protein
LTTPSVERKLVKNQKRQDHLDIIDRPTRLNHDAKTLRPLAIALITLVLAATAIAQAGKIDFQMLVIPSNLNISDGHSNFVIRSAQDWIAWINNLPDVVENLPTIDFERYTLLVVNAGYKAHGPFVVKFESVTETDNEVRVQVSVTGPVSCPQASESAHYAAMALIPHTDKPIQFDVSSRGSDCHH